jgi:hypothetical protein
MYPVRQLLSPATQRRDIRGRLGVDKVWEQRKLKARKMLEKRAESHTSAARFVRQNRISGPTHSQEKARKRMHFDIAGKTPQPFADLT